MAELTMTDSRWLNHKVVTHPASSLVQDRESSLAETNVLPTMLRCQRKINTTATVNTIANEDMS